MDTDNLQGCGIEAQDVLVQRDNGEGAFSASVEVPLFWRGFSRYRGSIVRYRFSVRLSSSGSAHPALAWGRCGRSVVGAQPICAGALTEQRVRASCNPGPGLVRQTRRRAVEEWHLLGLVLFAVRFPQVPAFPDRSPYILHRKACSRPEFITPSNPACWLCNACILSSYVRSAILAEERSLHFQLRQDKETYGYVEELKKWERQEVPARCGGTEL
jgi:hypothetical protein